MKALVAGWFSFEAMGATAGDLLARDSVCEWLATSGVTYDLATAPPFDGGVDWRTVNAVDYPLVVFVCGPFGNGPPLTDFLERFSRSRLFGVNVSMLQDLKQWNPFECLLERDSSRAARPDIALSAQCQRVPVVGVVLVHPQSEYGAKSAHDKANEAIQRLLAGREVARVNIDTRLDVNTTGLRTPAEIDSLIAAMDVVVTTRLHGLVLAIKNSVPALAVDPIRGGAKVYRQARELGWPAALLTDHLTDAEINAAYDFCLSPQGRERVAHCRQRALERISEMRDAFMQALETARKLR